MIEMWFLLGLVVVVTLIYNMISYVLIKFFNYNDVEAVICSLILAICIITACGYVDMANLKYEYYSTRSLVAMQDSQSYVVSRYNVESELKYLYMYKSGEDTYRASQAPANRSSIHTSSGDYKVEIYKQQKKIKIFKFFLPSEYVDAYKYEFYIPKDGIVSEFKVDLK